MNAFFGYFQLAALAVLLLVFVGRSVCLRFGRNINPFMLDVWQRTGADCPVVVEKWGNAHGAKGTTQAGRS